MIPSNQGVILGGALETVGPARMPSRTWRVDWEAGRVEGAIDGREAVRQAVWKILHTPRFAWSIYSWDYGHELDTLPGRRFSAVEGALPRLLREALAQDGRITGVSGVSVARTGRREASASFTVETIFGDIQEEVALRV